MVLADRGYDADWIRALVNEQGAGQHPSEAQSQRPHLLDHNAHIERAFLQFAAGTGIDFLGVQLCGDPQTILRRVEHGRQGHRSRATRPKRTAYGASCFCRRCRQMKQKPNDASGNRSRPPEGRRQIRSCCGLRSAWASCGSGKVRVPKLTPCFGQSTNYSRKDSTRPT